MMLLVYVNILNLSIERGVVLFIYLFIYLKSVTYIISILIYIISIVIYIMQATIRQYDVNCRY